MTTSTAFDVAQEWAANLIPVVPVRQDKSPHTGPDNRILRFDDPGTVVAALEELGPYGLAMALHPDSSIVVVDIDQDMSDGRRWLREHGVTRELKTWACQTPKAGFHLTFYWPSEWSDTPRRSVRVNGLPIDLLAKGQAISPPTRGYTWLPGRSPADIEVAVLAEVPAPLRERWTRGTPAPPVLRQGSGPDGWLADILAGTIPEGQRNNELTRIFGRLHRFHPPTEAEALLHEVNRRACNPPLSDREMSSIIASIGGREGYQGRRTTPLEVTWE